jgi:hypothetical protein
LHFWISFYDATALVHDALSRSNYMQFPVYDVLGCLLGGVTRYM